MTSSDRYEASQVVAFDAMVEQQDTKGSMTNEIAALPSVQAVRSVTFVFGGLVPLGSKAQVETLIFAGSQAAFGTRMIDGREPSGDHEFAASTRFIKSTGARVGDRFALFTIPQSQAAESGFAGAAPTKPTLEAVLVGEFTGPTELQNEYALAIFPPSLLDLGDAVGISATQHAVGLKQGATIRDLRQELNTIDSDQPFGINPANLVPDVVRDAVNARGEGILVVAVIMALATIAVLGQLLSRQFRLTDAQSRAMRAVGMTPRQLVADPVGRAAVPVLAGSVLAAALAYALSGVFPLGFVELVEPDPGLRLESTAHLLGPVVLAVGLLGWVTVSLASGARKGASVRPSRLVDTLAAKLRPAPAAVAMRFAFNHDRRDGGSPVGRVVGLAMVVGALVAALTFGASLARVIDEPDRHGLVDLAVGQGGGEVDEEALTKLVASPDVEAVARAGTVLVSVGADALDVLGLKPERGTIAVDVITGRMPVSNGEIVLGRVSARDLGLEVGDRFTVTVRDQKSSKPLSLRVTGVAVIPSVDSVDGVGTGGLVTIGGLVRLRSELPLPTILANIRPDATPDAATRLRRAIHGGRSDPPSVILNLGRVRSLPFVVAATLGFLAVLSLAHQLITSARNRRRDMAVLAALGASRRWVSSVVHWQATILALVVLVLAIPLGFGFGRLIFGAFIDRVGASDDATVSLWMLGVTIVGIVALANLVAAIPARRVRNQPLARHLSDE